LVNVYKRLINDFAFENCEICHEGGHGVLKGVDGIFRNPTHFFGKVSKLLSLQANKKKSERQKNKSKSLAKRTREFN
jgi:cell shape-determining protein MreC